MDSKTPFIDDEDIPAYSEKAPELKSSTHLQPDIHSPTSPPPPTLSALRTQRINSLITTTLSPHLSSQFTHGIYNRTLLLLPSDTLPLNTHPTLTPQSITSGIPSPNSEILFVRLPPSSPPSSFWLHKNIPPELGTLIRHKLRAMGHIIREPPGIFVPPTPRAQEPEPEPELFPPRSATKSPPIKSSWLKRGIRSARAQLSPSSDEQDPDVIWKTDKKLGWRGDNEGNEDSGEGGPWEVGRDGKVLEGDEVRVRCGMREVSFRAATEMGLWETVSAKVLIVEVEVGAG